MFRNPLCTFVLGGLVSAVIPVALADASRAGFVLGVLGVLGILGIALSSRKRVLWLARFLTRCAGPDVRTVRVDRVSPKSSRAAETQPKPESFVMMGSHPIKVDEGWQDFQKLSKRKKLDRQYQAWQDLGKKRIAARASEKAEYRSAHPFKPGDPNYEFMRSDLVGD